MLTARLGLPIGRITFFAFRQRATFLLDPKPTPLIHHSITSSAQASSEVAW
jgi:hypothetical protein